jgi:hypothetical protein
MGTMPMHTADTDIAFGSRPRRASVGVRVGEGDRAVIVGGAAPIVVQSMTNTDTADVEATARQIAALWRAASGGRRPLTIAKLRKREASMRWTALSAELAQVVAAPAHGLRRALGYGRLRRRDTQPRNAPASAASEAPATRRGGRKPPRNPLKANHRRKTSPASVDSAVASPLRAAPLDASCAAKRTMRPPRRRATGPGPLNKTPPENT